MRRIGSPDSQVFPIPALDGSCAQGVLGRAGFVSSRSAKPSTMFTINPQIDSETLLGIAQVIMLGELAVNRALGRLDSPESASHS
ncbi:hypothetical protein [Pseudomonas sp. GM55]|uniref:hypothetical protein n=1 Tax=Pseudomonas sp. GM55 TaxID=1144333 RepID=UPI00027077E8|nr:hypothetical protein [Pseudomonas sp. GM55]EJM69460.1 hypothetical protein PMI31_04675 [Pseudomonas sp. GM55]